MAINLTNTVFGNRVNLSLFVADAYTTDKIKIRNLYSSWNGETIESLTANQRIKPNLRIGLPTTDVQLKNDNIFFILDYLSYNPINYQIERRILYPQRIMSKLYIGQSPDEEKYGDADVIINGKLVVNKLITVEQNDDYMLLESKIKALEKELSQLKARVSDIYNQQTRLVE